MSEQQKEGWDSLNQEQQPPAPPKPDERDLLFGRVFKTEDGQKALAYLRAITIEKAAFNPGEDASYGYVRTGMAEIVRLIERCVIRSNNNG